MRLLLLSIFLLDVFFSSSQGVGYNPFPSTYSYINSNGPLGSNYSTGTFDLYFDVYIAGVTDNPGQGAGVTASVIIRKDTSLTDPAYGNATVAFAQFTAAYSGDNGSNDRYKVTIPAGIPNGRYSWESIAVYNSTTYLGWDYNSLSCPTCNLNYLTVGPTGIFRSMIIINNNGLGNTYYDMRKFQPGNTTLPAQITGSLGSGFCSSNTLTISGAEMNVFKNTQTGYSPTNVSATRIYYRVTAISATGTAPACLNVSPAWQSFDLNFRDNCPSGYPGNNSNKFTGGGSCQNQYVDNSNTDQRWDNTGANINLLALASSVCMPSVATGPITYRLDIYTEADVYTNPPNTTVTARDPVTPGQYYATTFAVTGLATTSQNGFNAGPGCTNILPAVSVVSFAGVRNNKDAILSWQVQNAGINYELQRSLNRIGFTTIYKVNDNFSNGRLNNYYYTDERIFSSGSSEYFYRLKINKSSGEASYSAIVRLTCKSTIGISAIQPNPFSDKLEFLLNLTAKDKLTIRLYDSWGRRIISQTNNYNTGIHTVQLNNLHSLNKGIYFIEIGNESGGTLYNEKLLHN